MDLSKAFTHDNIIQAQKLDIIFGFGIYEGNEVLRF